MNQAILLLLFPAAAALITPAGSVVSARFGRYLALLAYAAGIVYGVVLYPQIAAAPQSVIVGGWKPPFGINLFVSPLSLGLVVLVYFVAVVVLVSDIAAERSRRSQFYLLYSLLVMASIGIILTADLFNLFVFLEIAGIATFALVANGRRGSGSAGSLRYLVLAQMTTLLMLAGIGLAYSATGVLNIASLSEFAAFNPAFAFLVGVLILLPFLLELKQFPFNGWVGGAYRGASISVGATMSGLTTLAVGMVLARLVLTMMNSSSAFAGAEVKIRTLVLLLGAATVLVGEIAAFREREIKRVLAYSSVGQMGMIAIGVAIATQSAVRGVLFLLVSHTLAKVLLFLVAGSAARATGSDRWEEMKGFARRFPLLGVLFAVGAMTLMGIPLFSGFWGKIDLIRAAIGAGGLALVGIAAVLVATIIEGVYFMKIAHALFQAPETAEEHGEAAAPRPSLQATGDHATEPTGGQAAGAAPAAATSAAGGAAAFAGARVYNLAFLLPALVLAAATVVLGILPGLIDPWLSSATAELLHPVSGYAAHIVSQGGLQ